LEPHKQEMQTREQVRQSYLSAMGVTTWLPTRSLPGAPESPLWRWTTRRVSADKPGVPAKVAVSTGAPVKKQLPRVEDRGLDAPDSSKQPSVDLRQLLQDPVGHSAVETRQTAPELSAPEPPRALRSAATAEIPQFRLALIGYPGFLVVNELPLETLYGLTAHHQKFLGDILLALGYREPQVLQVQEIVWPMINNPFHDQGHQVAHDAVVGLVHRLEQRCAATRMLLLGQQAGRFVLGAEVEPGRLLTLDSGIKGVCSCSLNEAMKRPGGKRELWHHLQPLRRLGQP
jgi:hypothetical protein